MLIYSINRLQALIRNTTTLQQHYIILTSTTVAFAYFHETIKTLFLYLISMLTAFAFLSKPICNSRSSYCCSCHPFCQTRGRYCSLSIQLSRESFSFPNEAIKTREACSYIQNIPEFTDRPIATFICFCLQV